MIIPVFLLYPWLYKSLNLYDYFVIIFDNEYCIRWKLLSFQNKLRQSLKELLKEILKNKVFSTTSGNIIYTSNTKTICNFQKINQIILNVYSKYSIFFICNSSSILFIRFPDWIERLNFEFLFFIKSQKYHDGNLILVVIPSFTSSNLI